MITSRNKILKVCNTSEPTCSLHNFYFSISGVWTLYRRDERFLQNWTGNYGRDQLGDLDKTKRIILNWILKKWRGYGLISAFFGGVQSWTVVSIIVTIACYTATWVCFSEKVFRSLFTTSAKLPTKSRKPCMAWATLLCFRACFHGYAVEFGRRQSPPTAHLGILHSLRPTKGKMLLCT